MENKLSHSIEKLKWIRRKLKELGIYEYRFCIENDCYVCDKKGNFYSVCYRRTTVSGNIFENYEIRLLNGSIDRDGYRTYRITQHGKRKHLKAHRMMLNAWKGVQPSLQVNHIDGNKQNNKLSNLEWVTQSENMKHAYDTGIKHKIFIRNFGMYRIFPADWMTIYVLNKHFNYSKTKLSKMYNCNRTVIRDITKRINNVMKEVGI